jgi:hypothetical protein
LYWQGKPNELSKEGTLSFVLFETSFTSVSTSTVCRGHPSLVSLGLAKIWGIVDFKNTVLSRKNEAAIIN